MPLPRRPCLSAFQDGQDGHSVFFAGGPPHAQLSRNGDLLVLRTPRSLALALREVRYME